MLWWGQLNSRFDSSIGLQIVSFYPRVTMPSERESYLELVQTRLIINKNLNVLLRFLNNNGIEVEGALDWESGHSNCSPNRLLMS